MYGVYVETDHSKPIGSRLLNPHYSDERFRKSHTVFLAPGYRTVEQYGTEMVEGISYDYSDRLQQWNTDKDYRAAWKAAADKGLEKDSAAYLQEFLRELFHDPELKLVHLISGVNAGNGYPYRVYGYIRSSKSSE